MKLAYIMSQARGETDPRLAALAGHLMLRGVRLCGTIQVNTERGDGRHCDMDLMILPDGPALRISQDRGKWARGCRLDAGSLELAVAKVAAALDVGADLMIINKFGKHEAEGRGFRTVIGAALASAMNSTPNNPTAPTLRRLLLSALGTGAFSNCSILRLAT